MGFLSSNRCDSVFARIDGVHFHPLAGNGRWPHIAWSLNERVPCGSGGYTPVVSFFHAEIRIACASGGHISNSNKLQSHTFAIAVCLLSLHGKIMMSNLAML